MTFQLLRPHWLWMLLPLFTLAWFMWRRHLHSRDWAAVVDAKLLPHLLVGKPGRKALWPLLLWLMLGVLCVIALSGPAWKKATLPVYTQQSALVILLDLSSSMDSTDIKPSRLARARLKLIDLLKMRREGQTALIAFAATPYTVSPLTDDTATIQSLVDSLTSDIMPVQGSRTDLALNMALQLFSNAGIQRGDILLITDGLSDHNLTRIEALDLSGYRVSILAVGTRQGGPVPAPSGGFLKDEQGSIVVAKTNHDGLSQLAGRLGGVYSAMMIDDGDLNRLQKFVHSDELLAHHELTDFKADRWLEEGPWLLLLLTPLAALAFRRGVILSCLLVVMLMPVPQPAAAFDLPDWESLWKTPDQRAQQAFTDGDAEKAASLFLQPDWKAAAHYRAGEYEQALEELATSDTADGLYNRGNALAKMGRLQEALDSYDELLKQQPDHEDGKYNRAQVEQALKKQQQQQQQNKDQQQDNKQHNDEQEQQENGEQNSEQSEGGEQDKSQAQNSDETENQTEQQSEQSSEQSPADQQNASPSGKEEEMEQALQEALQKRSEELEKEQRDKDEKSALEEDAEAQSPEQEQNAQPQPMSSEERAESLSEQAEAQWLRRIPDDPGGLLRNKFRYQYSRQPQPAQEKEPW